MHILLRRASLFLMLILMFGCAGPIKRLSTDKIPDLSKNQIGIESVELCLRPIVKATDRMIYQEDSPFKDIDMSPRYVLPLLTVLDNIVQRRIDEVFVDHINDPTRSCVLEFSVPMAHLKHKGAGRPAFFSLDVDTQLKGPNGQVLDRKRFRTVKSGLLDGFNVPDAVWEAADDVAGQAVKYYAANGMVLALAEKFQSESDVVSYRKSSKTAPQVTEYDPRKPESAAPLDPREMRKVARQNRWRALLIGISDYSATRGYATNLGGIPTRDVKALKDVLEMEYGFEDTVVLADKEATRHGILAAFSKLHETTTPDDNILIYYAGHGFLPSYGVGVWIPSDAKSQEDGISNSEIKDRVANLPAKRVLVVSDSCFSGSFLTRAIGLVPRDKIVKKPDVSSKISAEIVGNRRASRQVLTSGSLKPVPNSGSGAYRNNSPFAGTLLAALESAKPGAVLSLTDLYTDLSYNVQQTENGGDGSLKPMKGSMPGHAGGEFFFLRQN